MSKTIPELRTEIKDLRFRLKCDKANHCTPDPYAVGTIPKLEFELADKLYFARLYHLKYEGKDTTKDAQLARLGVRLDKALAAL